MQIRKIDFNKVQVLITAVDLMTFDMDMESLRPNSPALHTFLFEIMDKIQSETGFNPNNGQIIIEAAQAGGESIMLTVTKLARNNTGKHLSRKQIKNIKAVARQPKKSVSVYAFESFDDVRSLLGRVRADALSGGGLYELEGVYYLEVYLTSADRSHPLIEEYALERDASELSAAFLTEHAKTLAQGEKLVALAKGIKRYGL
jgi:negative regulator of genetic competence, sporulation and motility